MPTTPDLHHLQREAAQTPHGTTYGQPVGELLLHSKPF